MEDDTREPQLIEPLDGLPAPRLVPGRQDDRDAAAGQLAAHLEADPFVPSGDDGDPGNRSR